MLFCQKSKQVKMKKPKKILFTENAPEPQGPYSQAVIYGDLVFVSGQGPVDPKTNKIIVGSIEEEAECTLKNIKTILLAAGSSPENALKVTVYLSDMEYFQRFNKIYEKYFSKNPPARTCIQAGRLPMDIKVEVDVIGYIDR